MEQEYDFIVIVKYEKLIVYHGVHGDHGVFTF
jgi:hypothetical protein